MIVSSNVVPTEYDVEHKPGGPYTLIDDHSRRFTGATLDTAFEFAEDEQDPDDPIHLPGYPFTPADPATVGFTRPGAPRLRWQGKHRTWCLMERQGTAVQDKFTVLGLPIPGDGNPALDYEDGQYPDMNAAYDALLLAEEKDDGTHLN